MAIFCLKAHAKGMVQKHLANVEIYLKNPAGVGEQVRGELTSPKVEIRLFASCSASIGFEPRFDLSAYCR